MYEKDTQVQAPAEVSVPVRALSDDELAACAGGDWKDNPDTPVQWG